jgi:hypothetical protein
MIARYVRSICRQSSEIGEVSSLLDMYCTPLPAALQICRTLPGRKARYGSTHLNLSGKHIAKRHLTGNYSSKGTIWLVQSYCLFNTALVDNRIITFIISLMV